MFDERTTRFYAASVILGFEEIHSKDVVYRDLKPENLLLDSEGYVKITDFGLSKYIPSGRTHTLCGTSHYLAPEIINGSGHGKAVDFWCLGVLIYEMLIGYPPFYIPGERSDHTKLYRRITCGNFQSSNVFSPDAWDLICRLLQLKPYHRLGTGASGFSRLKKHPWFLGFDWARLVTRTLRAPIIPYIRTDVDLHNFRKPNAMNYNRLFNTSVPVTDQSWDAEF
uniref:cAMP-dependent protein kinase catalytic subunit beta n=1 Tax=Lygus hesperus TaxID=30085 RepID=A0A0A9Z0P5_LYGHE